MPKPNSITRCYSVGHVVYERRDGHDFAICHARGYDAKRDSWTVAVQIADALNAAEENRDRPWEGKGPTPEEAGGGSILFRYRGSSDMDRALYTWTRSADGDGEGWMCDGDFLDEESATGWRPMPKANP